MSLTFILVVAVAFCLIVWLVIRAIRNNAHSGKNDGDSGTDTGNWSGYSSDGGTGGGHHSSSCSSNDSSVSCDSGGGDGGGGGD